MVLTTLEKVKVLLQILDNSQDSLLSALIERCGEEFLARTHQSETEEMIVIEMVVERYNRLGNEGISSINYSGISESFESDYSERVQKLIRSRTRLVMI